MQRPNDSAVQFALKKTIIVLGPRAEITRRYNAYRVEFVFFFFIFVTLIWFSRRRAIITISVLRFVNQITRQIVKITTKENKKAPWVWKNLKHENLAPSYSPVLGA